MTAAATTPLVALHLSDIHFGQERGEDNETNADARNQLIRKVREIAQTRAKAGQSPIGSIIITGDIAYSGQQWQYEKAYTWLTAVAKAAGCDPLSVQVVPGNHDVDRGTSTMVNGMIKELFRLGAGHLHKVLNNDEDRAALYKRLNAYQAFANGYGCALNLEGGNAGEKEHHLAPGMTLRIVGLNSALLCCGKENDKKPKLLLGARQRIIPEVDDAEYIILTHHPMSWLRDGTEAQAYIDNRARILMCGHEHRPKLTVRAVEDNCELLVIDAGATVPDSITEEYTYAFNVIEIDLCATRDAIDVTVDTYKWRESAKRFHQDVSDHEAGAPRRRRLRCPKFAAAALGAEQAAPAARHAALAVAGPEPVSTDEQLEAIDMSAAGSKVTSSAHRYAQARSDFFHNLGMAQRLAVLVGLAAVPEGIETLSANLMLRQLDRLHAKGRTEELIAAIAAAQQGE